MAVELIPKAIVSKEYAEQFVWSDPTARTDNEKDGLYRLINAVSEAIDKLPNHINFIISETTEFFDGGSDQVFLRNFPIVDITSVYEDGEELDAPTGQGEGDGDWDYYKEEGIIYKQSGYFIPGRQKVKVTYTSGLGTNESEMPEDVKLACVAWINQVNDAEIENYGTIITAQTMVRPTDMPQITRKLLQPYKKKKV